MTGKLPDTMAPATDAQPAPGADPCWERAQFFADLEWTELTVPMAPAEEPRQRF
jgi:hypothetical protein